MPPAAKKSPYAAAFGAVIRRLRDGRRMTIRQLAARSNVHPTQLSLLERGGNTPSVLTLFWLASAFDMPASEIVRAVEEELRAKQAHSETP